LTVQVPSHVRLGTTSWDLSGSDGLGTPRDDPDFFGRGLSLTNSRFQGSGTFDSGIGYSVYQQKRKIEWPHKGFVWSYRIKLVNDTVNTYFKHSFVPAGGLSDAIATIKDASLVIWYSKSPGGEPLITTDGTKRVFELYRIEQFSRIYQRYSILDAKNSKGDVGVPGYDGDNPNGRGSELILPIINKTYYINFAGVTSTTAALCVTKTGNTVNPNPRAPRADELLKFDASDIDGRPNLSFISQASTVWVPYQTYLEDVT
jgi:hypothetical protein